MNGRRTMRGLGLVVLGLLAGTLVACGGGRERRAREPGAAVWATPAAVPLAAETAERLQAAGVVELFLEGGRIENGAGTVRVERLFGAAPRTVGRTMLVVRGRAPEGKSGAEALANELRAVVAEADGRGIRPAGLHLDFDPVPSGLQLIELLGPVRKALPADRLLSVTIPRTALGDRDLPRVAKLTDFWVVFLFGQRPGEAEEFSFWDFYRTEQDARRVDALGEPFLLGVSTLATCSRLGPDGGVREVRTAFRLFPLLVHRGLERVPGSLLLGVDCQVVELRTRSRLGIDGWRLEPKDRLRMVRAPVHLVEELERLAGSWGLARHLGQLFYRLPEAGEGLSLSGAALAAALEPGAATPEIEVAIETLPARSGRLRFRVHLQNRSDLPTEIAALEHNFLTLHAPGARVHDVDLGEFSRYDLARSDACGERRGVLRADEVRLFVPMLEAGAEIVSGPLELIAPGRSQRLLISFDFLLPDGRVLAPPATEWELGN
jgi:hypothetical protein